MVELNRLAWPGSQACWMEAQSVARSNTNGLLRSDPAR